MIFHENDSHEISYLIIFLKLGKMLKNMSSAAVVIGALRVKIFVQSQIEGLQGASHQMRYDIINDVKLYFQHYMYIANIVSQISNFIQSDMVLQ